MGEEDYFDYSDVDVDESRYNTVIEGEDDDFPGLDDESTGWNQVKQFLERSEESQRRRLVNRLGRIETEIDKRREVYQETVETIENRVETYSKRLKQLYGLPSTGPDEKKEDLKRELSRLYDNLRSERSDAWRDVQRLEQQKREVQEELEELENSSLSELF
jgi:chromosome segregation ATPase